MIKCIAIDDEPLAVKKIAGYIGKVPFLELVAECRSAAEAMSILDTTDVQLLFIDINMPEISGMEFVKSLTNKPYVVFTTAYSEYAVEGFQVEAVDYLLKPITFSNFLKAANKVKTLIELTANSHKEIVKTTANHLFVKSDYKLIRIDLADIKYIESQHEYIKIHLANSNPVMTQLSLKSMEEQLPSDRFMRVHRSYIVNLAKVSVVERNRIVFDGNIYIPVSDQYKGNFQSYIDKSFLI
ncbi:MAG: LytTR family DNA-binding domain-containing protein [Bacteroidales bacterium]|nr:LytTR family DNA-binding domain-containing protein [Bacteroidales bacterium]